MKTDNIELENTSSEKLLGTKIDSKLNLKEHLSNCIIPNYTLHESHQAKVIDEFVFYIPV